MAEKSSYKSNASAMLSYPGKAGVHASTVHPSQISGNIRRDSSIANDTVRKPLKSGFMLQQSKAFTELGLTSGSDRSSSIDLRQEHEIQVPPRLPPETDHGHKMRNDERVQRGPVYKETDGKGQQISIAVSYYIKGERISGVIYRECTVDDYMRWNFIKQSTHDRRQFQIVTDQKLTPLSVSLYADGNVSIISDVQNTDDVNKICDSVLHIAFSQEELNVSCIPVEKSQVNVCLNIIKESKFGITKQVLCEIIKDDLFYVYSARYSEIAEWINDMTRPQREIIRLKQEWSKLMDLINLQEELRLASGSENLQVRLYKNTSSVSCSLEGTNLSIKVARQKLSDLDNSIHAKETELGIRNKKSLCELELEEPLNEMLRQENIVCTVDQKRDKIYVYGFSTLAVVNGSILIGRNVTEKVIILHGEHRNPSFVDNIVKQFGGRTLVIHPELNNSNLYITGLKKAACDAFEDIQRLMSGFSVKGVAPQRSVRHVMKEGKMFEYFCNSSSVEAEKNQNQLSISVDKDSGENSITVQGDVLKLEKCNQLIRTIENEFRCDKWRSDDINACEFFVRKEGKTLVRDCAVKNDIIIHTRTTYYQRIRNVKEIDEFSVFPSAAVRQKFEWSVEEGKRRILLQLLEKSEDKDKVLHVSFSHTGPGKHCVTVPHWDNARREAMTSAALKTLFSQIEKGSFDVISIPVDPELDWPQENFAVRIASFAAEVLFCARSRSSLSVYLVMNDDKNFVQVSGYVREALKFYVEAEEERLTEQARQREMTKVSVVLGELDNIEVGAIVNSTSPDLNLSNGRVSAKLLKKAGPKLQDECKAKYTSGIKPDQIAVTGGYMLLCRQVFHIALKRYNDRNSRDQLKLIEWLVLHCLKIASSDGLQSVAFPALGTGNLQYPEDLVASAMFEGVEQFRREVRDSQLQKVLFVVYHKDSAVLQAFQNEEQRWAAQVAPPTITSIAEFELRGLKEQVNRVKQSLEAKCKEIQDDAEKMDLKEISGIERTHYVGLKFLFKKELQGLDVDVAYESSLLKVTGKRKVLDQAMVEVEKLLKKISSDECHPVPVKEIERKVIEEKIALINNKRKQAVCVYDEEMEVVLVFGKAERKVAHKLCEDIKDIRAQSASKKGPTQEQEESSLQSLAPGDGTQPTTDVVIFQATRTNNILENLGPSYHGTKEHDGEVPGSQKTPKCTKYIAGTLKVLVYQGNILEVQADCLVNPANGELQHDGGLALQIAKCGEKKLAEELEQIRKRRGGPLQVTEVEVTSGFKFFAKILHAVGPCWSKYEPLTEESVDRCAKDLQSTIQNCLRKADVLKMFSIALPTVSSGLFRVPLDLCAHAYAKAIVDFSQEQSNIKEIHMVDIEERKIAVINKSFTAIIERKEKIVFDSKRYIQAPDAERQDKHETVQKNTCRDKTSERETSADTDDVFSEVEAVRFCKSKGKFCCMFSETLRMYVYSGDIVQCKGIDAVVCVENRSGQAEDIITKQLSEKGGEEYIKRKKTEFQSCKDNGVFVTEGWDTQFKHILHLVIPKTGIKDLKAMYKEIFSSITRLEIFSAALNILQADDAQSGTENSALSLWMEWMQFCRDTKDSDNLFLLHIILPDDEQEERVKKIFGKQFAGKKEESGEKNSSRVAPKVSLVNQTEKPASTKHVSTGVSATKASQDKGEDCVICMDKINKEERLKCGHVFCKECIESYFQVCPTCGKVCGVIYGDQPDGTMTVFKLERSLEGYEGCRTIAITYQFEGGNQRFDHPCPGTAYRGIERTAYLPDNKEGREICAMLTVAFERRLVFTIGRSRTTGHEGVITWNDIHHKTNPKPNSQFGYPDPTYLQRVREELEVKGVTKDDVDLQLMKRLEDKFYKDVFRTDTYV